MNPLRSLCLMACLVAAVCATTPNQKKGGNRSNSLNGNLKPTNWLPVSELEALPDVNGITLQELEKMPVEEGANLIKKLYHLSQISETLEPTFVPSANDIPAYIVQSDGQKVSFTLNHLVKKAKEQGNDFGDDEVTVFITGLPQNTQTVTKATRQLVNAYMQRYNIQQQRQQQSKMNKDYDYGSNEDYDTKWTQVQPVTGDLIVIDLGSAIRDFEEYAMLDVEKTGAVIAEELVAMTDKTRMPFDNIHIVAQGIAAHVAGAAGRQFSRQTGHQLRRITALDPSKIIAKKSNALTGLARGDAEFVDAIHTSVYGMGTTTRVGDVDFYVNGLSAGVPGADNVIEASMRATRYFAESVRPGNERNFPAVAATSLKEYKNQQGYGKRVFMGIDTDFDLEGDYILQVNSKAPFGKRAAAQKQSNFHGSHGGAQNWDLKSKDY